MRRVLADANIYGRIIEKFDELLVRKAKEKGVLKGFFVIYGFDVIRKELRATPSNIRYKNKKIRMMLLSIYDFIVGEKNFKISPEMVRLKEQYIKVYKKLGGSYGKEELSNDFLIVACASVKKLDIIYSEDNKTMRNSVALKSYDIVNELNNLRTPNFENYEQFIKEIKRMST